MRHLLSLFNAPKPRDGSRRRTSRAVRLVGEGLEPRMQLSAQAVGAVLPPALVQNTPTTHVTPATDFIAQKYASLGGRNGFLGAPTTAKLHGPNGGRFQDYQNGAIYWSPSTGAHEVHGAILGKYLGVGGPSGFLGYPTSDESAAAGSGRFSAFQGGRVYWTQSTGAHEVHGAILGEYLNLGGSGSFLGFPTADEGAAAGGGRVSTFQGGRVYWTQATGAHEVHGAILSKYLNFGGSGGLLGFPTADESAAANGGRVSTFQGGRVYWTQATGAHEVHGPILAKYLSIGGPASNQRYPTSDVLAGPNGGQYQTFSWGNIYSSPATGAHVVQGSILNAYINDVGGPGGRLGYPISDEVPLFTVNRVSHFQHGDIQWLAGSGTIIVVQF